MPTALVIDDSSTVRRLLRRMLEQLGFDVRDAADGRSAVETLDADPAVDVALVDWNMPEMNGLEVIRAVRSDDAHAELRILVVTTETEVPRMVEALEAGADEYLMKPFSAAALADKLALLGVAGPVVS